MRAGGVGGGRKLDRHRRASRRLAASNDEVTNGITRDRCAQGDQRKIRNQQKTEARHIDATSSVPSARTRLMAVFCARDGAGTRQDARAYWLSWLHVQTCLEQAINFPRIT
jgi:hypothetical protein